jgi:hypothetical protein
VVVTGGPRPWWASEADAAASDPVDPVDAHRAARRGGFPTEDPAAWWDGQAPPEGGPAGEAHDRARADQPGHGPDVCGVCPLCAALRALGETRPQLVEHLTEAARHLAAAFRSVVDEPRPDEADEPRDRVPFERIDLD